MSTSKRPRHLVPPGSTKKPPRPAVPIDARVNYDMQETCGHLRLSRAYIYRLFRDRKLTPKKNGKRTLVAGAELLRFMSS